MEKSKIIENLISTSCNLDKDEDEKSIEESKYQGMLGSLLYLSESSLDIMFDIRMCACFQASPKTNGLTVSQGSEL